MSDVFRHSHAYFCISICFICVKIVRIKWFLTLENKNGKKPKFTQVGRAHGITKNTIIGTTNTVYYIIPKYLTNLLYYLTEYTFTVNNSFEIANQIGAIPSELFVEDFRFITFIVTSLFTKVLLNRTIKLVFKGLYECKFIHTTLMNNEQ